MASDDDINPVFMAPPPYLEIRDLVRKAVGFPGRRHAVIGVDGKDGAGKSPLSAWLNWQLGIPAVHLDLYMIRESDPLQWQCEDLRRVLDRQKSLNRPVIVEGVALLQVLHRVDCTPDFLVFVERARNESSMRKVTTPYFKTWKPKAKADYVLRWSTVEYDDQVVRAHLARD